MALVILAGACTGEDLDGAGGRDGKTSTDRSGTTTPAPTPPDDPPPAPAPLPRAISVSLGAARAFTVDGTYPPIESSCRRFRQPTFEAAYPGDVHVEREDGGTLRVIVTVPFDTYLEGIAEVPPSWPRAALDAQAIAARSYALARIGFTGPDGADLDTPICATADCQVYGGIPLEPVPDVRRWYAAVRRTAGRTLVFEGRPADAVYFSTSNGRTYGNDEVFGSGPLPYLRGIVEHDDGASPTSRWRVPLRYRDLAAFLTARGLWDGRRIVHVVRQGDVVDVRGGGTTRRIDEVEFRGAVNGAAPCLFPGRYPTDSRVGSALPLTIPSRWYTTSAGGRSVVFTGRGWGHGVGMVQWGAYGKARRGWTAERILAAYYGGLEPEPFPEPGRIRVLVADGLTSLRIAPRGTGATLDGASLDGRSVTIEPGGRGVRARVRSAR